MINMKLELEAILKLSNQKTHLKMWSNHQSLFKSNQSHKKKLSSKKYFEW